MTPRKTTDKIRRILKMCPKAQKKKKNLHSNSFSALPTTTEEMCVSPPRK